MVLEPASEYRSRLARWQERYAALSRTDAQLAGARLVIFGAALVLAYSIWRTALEGWLLVVPAAVFAVAAIRHDVVIRARAAASSLIGFYERGIARIEDRWIGNGHTGEQFRDPSHPCADDLDLFGRGSLFELLSMARTRAGERALAGWLTVAADPAVVMERQAAVRELTPLLDLRELLSLAPGLSNEAVHEPELLAWAEAPPALSPPWMRVAALGLTAFTLASFAYWYVAGTETLVYLALVAQSAFALPRARHVERLLHVASGPARELSALAQALTLLERESFTSPLLTALQAELRKSGVKASVAIARLQRLSEMHDWQHNLVFAPIALVLMWSTHLAWALEAWRRRYGRHVRVWLRVVGDFEALASLSAYACEHPADPFPEIVPLDGHATPATGLFEGTGLGHPLVPAAKMVRNDVSLSAQGQLLVVSGSNMSGKSTLLRTVGVNVVLAQAGAPVRAASLRLTPLAVGATLRIQDSLQEGRSRFYAEISRVSLLARMACERPPLLFLLDELFHGTNSHDRLVGAAGVLRTLLDRGAIGLITTHDLALTAIVDALGPRAANVHFEDSFDGTEMHFDYLKKTGPVTKSNALALMRAVGLDVSES
jgi:hypothetical protein